jgi:hypothetical protein
MGKMPRLGCAATKFDGARPVGRIDREDSCRHCRQADSLSKIFLPNDFGNHTGTRRAKVINIDRFRENDRKFMEKQGN